MMYRKAIQGLENSRDPDEVGLATMLLLRLGQLHQQRQENDKAEPLLRRALQRAGDNKDPRKITLDGTEKPVPSQQRTSGGPVSMPVVPTTSKPPKPGSDAPTGTNASVRCKLALGLSPCQRANSIT